MILLAALMVYTTAMIIIDGKNKTTQLQSCMDKETRDVDIYMK